MKNRESMRQIRKQTTWKFPSFNIQHLRANLLAYVPISPLKIIPNIKWWILALILIRIIIVLIGSLFYPLSLELYWNVFHLIRKYTASSFLCKHQPRLLELIGYYWGIKPLYHTLHKTFSSGQPFTLLSNWSLQPFRQDYNLASHNTYAVCVNFKYERRYLQFKVNFERQIFGKLLIEIFIYSLMVFSFLPKKKCALYFKKCNLVFVS